jgi:rfaE bifunctional protein kinase chain/domain
MMNVTEILSDIKQLRVLVAGDICLDRWCYYDPSESEPSRETGIPRIGVVRTVVTPGAGGTIANNLVALGVDDVSVLGAIGEDGSGHELQRVLRSRSISSKLLVASNDVATFTYTKLINLSTGEEDRPRVDFINVEKIPAAVETQILARLSEQFRSFDVVIVSDQAETEQGGAITARVRERIVELADTYRDRVVWVDSRKRAEHFRKVVLKPNAEEAREACARRFNGEQDALRRWVQQNDLRALVVTHGADGAQVIDRQGESWVKTRRVKAVDICGAGDSFSAGAACALAATGSLVDAARFGNLVASVTVTKKGTGTASRQELEFAAREMPA